MPSGATVVSAAAQPDPSTPEWVLEGFSVPESVAFDSGRNILYVANVAVNRTEKNGTGCVSRISPGGRMLEREWVSGL